jgi:hypothetical protein
LVLISAMFQSAYHSIGFTLTTTGFSRFRS